MLRCKPYMEKHPLHIKSPELQTSPEVNRAVVREERKTFEKMPNDPSERIEAYMDRLENVFLNPDEKKRERNLDMFRDKIYDAFIIKKENFPESYFELQKRIARERGQVVEDIPENVREQMMDVAIEDQRASLDAWIDYLTSDDAMYPAWFKYFVWKNVTKLSQFDKERGEFKKRTDSTVAPYPGIYREPLAQIADIYLKVKEENKNLKEPEIREAFSKKFPTLYVELISKSLAASMENREEIKGEWMKYEQRRGSDAEKLFQSLQGKGTGWCTAGKSTAKMQIENGDFYVYYTNDGNGEPTQPRLAIRMEGDNRIGEVRGILPHQGVEPIMQEALDSKLQDFGGEADAYRKKSSDMKILTSLDQKKEQDQPFTKDDLVFLYEINSSIEGFGYQRDPRIDQLLQGRDVKSDIATAIGCKREEISVTEEEALMYGVKFHYGNLILNNLTSAEGLTLPKEIGGNLNLLNLTSAEGLTLPEKIGGSLFLFNLTSAEGLTLPEKIGGSLNLLNLTSAEGLTLPKEIGGVLYLSNLTSAEGLTLPEKIGGDLNLDNLTSAEGLTLPEKIGGVLYLDKLTSAEEKSLLRIKYPSLRIV
jgi:hypothetical protein